MFPSYWMSIWHTTHWSTLVHSSAGQLTIRFNENIKDRQEFTKANSKYDCFFVFRKTTISENILGDALVLANSVYDNDIAKQIMTPKWHKCTDVFVSTTIVDNKIEALEYFASIYLFGTNERKFHTIQKAHYLLLTSHSPFGYILLDFPIYS